MRINNVSLPLNAEIERQKEESEQKYDNSMSAATTAAAQGIAEGVAPQGVIGDIAEVMIAYQKIAEKEARADRKEQRNEEVQTAKGVPDSSPANQDENDYVADRIRRKIFP